MIEVYGPLTVAQYMRECLTHPRFGYYVRHEAIGRRGDFVTAPELTQVFGEMVGVWMADAWSRLNAPTALHVVELGPGRGTLMSDALRVLMQATRRGARAPVRLDVHLVEASATMRARQRERLEPATRAGVGLHWYDSITQLPNPPGAPVLLVANEFFDALPVHVLRKTGPAGAWSEVLVDIEEGGRERKLRFVSSAPHTGSSAVALVSDANGMYADCAALPEGAQVEVSLAAHEIARDVVNLISSEHGGSALVIDYGLDARPSDTLMAFKDHEQVGPLDLPGDSDLTSYVDFAAMRSCVESAGAASGARFWGPVTQGEFLLLAGIRERVGALCERFPERATDVVESARRLVEANQMGERYKAVCVERLPAKPATAVVAVPPVGFLG